MKKKIGNKEIVQLRAWDVLEKCLLLVALYVYETMSLYLFQ